MATVYVYGASIDENGKASGGKAGNQTGRELKKQKWYKHDKTWRVFRAKNPGVAAKIAQCAKAAVANRHIGYDQGQRNSLYREAAKFGFDVSRVTKDVECDCSALVRVCCAFAGIEGLPADFRTTNEPKLLLATGAFEEMTGAKYTDKPDYLRAGDILCTKTQGHTVVVGNDGPKAGEIVVDGLSKGDYGRAVEAMQEALLKAGYDLGDYGPKHNGVDGEFGKKTEDALKAFQKASGLPVTGVYDEVTRNTLTHSKPPVGPKELEITGDLVNVRAAPKIPDGKVLGVVKKGARLEYQGESRDVGGTKWHLVIFKNQNAWVSGKFSKLV